VSLRFEIPRFVTPTNETVIHTEPSDEELVSRLRAGDEDALSQLYRRYVAPIYRFVFAQVREVADAEDLTSETFAKMMRGIGAFRGEASFKNWLYQIARNSVRNHRRSSAYRRVLPIDYDMTVADVPEAAGNDEAAARVLAVLRPLPPRYRQILELRFLRGWTVEQAAAAMGVTVGNAKVLQHRALRKAATHWEEVSSERTRAR
jgi:RNA polymerase sigma-70 factor (ECF subfamily)